MTGGGFFDKLRDGKRHPRHGEDSQEKDKEKDKEKEKEKEKESVYI